MPNDIIQRIRDAYADNQATALELLPELFKQYNDGQIEVISSKAISVEDRQDALWCRNR
jgi:hypothetical protein